MNRNDLFLLLASAAAGGLLLTGCSLEGDSCSSDSDCGTFACDLSTLNDDGNGTCFTECTTNAQCAAGNVCGADGTCGAGEPEPGCTTDTDCEGGYICDEGTCATSCTEEASECVDGYVCIDDACEIVPETPWAFVAVVSEVPTTSADVTGSNNPGPDVDAVEIRRGGAQIPAAAVEGFVIGAAPENSQSDPNRILGVPDAMIGDGPEYNCLTADGSGYVSIGGTDGFVIVSFGEGEELMDGDVVRVYELERRSCSNSLANRADVYSVYISTDANAATSDAIRTAWCSLGTTPNNVGGVFDFPVSIATCEN